MIEQNTNHYKHDFFPIVDRQLDWVFSKVCELSDEPHPTELQKLELKDFGEKVKQIEMDCQFLGWIACREPVVKPEFEQLSLENKGG